MTPDSGSRTKELFWSKVDTSGECWVWQACRSAFGYGRIRIEGKEYRAHRVSYIWEYGPIPDGVEVCHRCENPPCVRPSHLFLGSHSVNMTDASTKGRNATHLYPERRPRGERHGNTHLKVGDVDEIRKLALSGIPQRTLAKRYSVHQATIHRIVRHKVWK